MSRHHRCFLFFLLLASQLHSKCRFLLLSIRKKKKENKQAYKRQRRNVKGYKSTLLYTQAPSSTHRRQQGNYQEHAEQAQEGAFFRICKKKAMHQAKHQSFCQEKKKHFFMRCHLQKAERKKTAISCVSLISLRSTPLRHTKVAVQQQQPWNQGRIITRKKGGEGNNASSMSNTQKKKTVKERGGEGGKARREH